MPPHVKELVDKASQDSAKALTKAMHNATSALGRAKKAHCELVEAKRAHRQNWLKHLESSVGLWNQQLEEFRRKQAEFQTSVVKSAQEVESARKQILTLGARDTKLALQLTEEEEEAPVELTADQEEETLRLQLQRTLESCAASLGPPPQETSAIDLEDDSVERPPVENPQKRRAVSAEPHAGGPTLNSSA